jgi:DinB superfamily
MVININLIKQKMKPNQTDCPPYYHNYINLISTDDLVEALENNMKEAMPYLKSFPIEKENKRYEAGKWTPKQVLLHVVDGERIFNYRALSIARGDQQALQSFEEDLYASNDESDNRSFQSIVEEFVSVRLSTISLFKNFTENQLSKLGVANNYKITVNAIGFFTVGHAMHHFTVLKERY